MFNVTVGIHPIYCDRCGMDADGDTLALFVFKNRKIIRELLFKNTIENNFIQPINKMITNIPQSSAFTIALDWLQKKRQQHCYPWKDFRSGDRDIERVVDYVCTKKITLSNKNDINITHILNTISKIIASCYTSNQAFKFLEHVDNYVKSKRQCSGFCVDGNILFNTNSHTLSPFWFEALSEAGIVGEDLERLLKLIEKPNLLFQRLQILKNLCMKIQNIEGIFLKLLRICPM